MKIRHLLPLVALLFSPLSATAQEAKTKEITGAFGVKLGQVIDPKSDKYKPLEGSGNEGGYLFEPEKGKRSGNFDNYYFLVTPKSNKVSSIGCLSLFESESEAIAKYTAVLNALEKIYGKFKEQDTRLSFGVKAEHEKMIGNKIITIKRQSLTSNRVSIMYIDFDTFDLGKKEKVEIESSKIDPSGF